MPYVIPPPRGGGPKVADLAGRLLAIKPLVSGEQETPYGPKFSVFARVVEIDPDTGETTELGNTPFRQLVLAEDLGRVPENTWQACRIVKYDRAWLFEGPEDHELPAVERAIRFLENEDNDDQAF